jgi:hypothetical protein
MSEWDHVDDRGEADFIGWPSDWDETRPLRDGNEILTTEHTVDHSLQPRPTEFHPAQRSRLHKAGSRKCDLQDIPDRALQARSQIPRSHHGRPGPGHVSPWELSTMSKKHATTSMEIGGDGEIDQGIWS